MRRDRQKRETCYVVRNGAVVLEDTGKGLLTNEMVRAAYLGL
jgi:ABC-type lipopolysaccharide export system ATPase subunit